MAMKPRVTVVVVNHNRAELLVKCLASLARQTYGSFEVVVVDNGSSDGSAEAVRSFPDSRVRLLCLEENRGFAGGTNAGRKEARGELIALLNNDAVARECWLEKLVEAADSDARVGMCASKILFSGTNLIDKTGHLMYPDGQNRGRGTGESDRGQYDQAGEIFFPDGCAALYRRRLLEEVGGFDERFFAYGDDADLGVRARWLGWKCLYVPEAVVYHHHSSTTGRFSEQKIYWIERNRLWLAVKCFPLPLLAVTPLLTLNRWMWNLGAALLGRGAAGSFRKEASWGALLRTLGRACWDGLRGLGQMWEARRQIRTTRRISDGDFYGLLWRFRISARVVAFQEHNPARGSRGSRG